MFYDTLHCDCTLTITYLLLVDSPGLVLIHILKSVGTIRNQQVRIGHEDIYILK